MKRYRIFFVIVGLFIVASIFKINLNLNRQIYNSIINYEGSENILYDNKDSYNLDQMVDVLTYPYKYEIENLNIGDKKETFNIPKIRILFNKKPFDFRIDTNKYMFFLNNRVFLNLKNQFKNDIIKFKKFIYDKKCYKNTTKL